MSKNSQKLNYNTLKLWLIDINPKSESLHQPKMIEPVKQLFKRRN
jgi:hypothetical protein